MEFLAELRHAAGLDPPGGVYHGPPRRPANVEPVQIFAAISARAAPDAGNGPHRRHLEGRPAAGRFGEITE